MTDTFDSLIDKVNSKLKDANLYYLSNDPERALGLEEYLDNYHIVYIDETNYEENFKSGNIKYFCLNEHVNDDIYRSSVKLIKSKKFIEYFNSTKKNSNYFQTFKISSAFSFGANAFGVKVLNTSSALNHLFEDKVSQYKEIKDIGISLPETFTARLKEVNYSEVKKNLGESFVIQFNRGHTGSGTLFIKSESDFVEVQNKFPMMEVKFCEFVTGNAYTLNAVVGRNAIYMGGLSFQITGVEGLTPNLGGTIGNDWTYRKDFANGVEFLKRDVQKIGEKMRSKGYLGLFGVDLIVDANGQHFIIEINARQPASIPMHTKMQIYERQIPLSLLHIAEFLEVEYEIEAEEYNNIGLQPLPYSQVFIRPTNDMVLNDNFEMGIYKLKGDMLNNNRIITGDKPYGTYFIDEDKDKALVYDKSAYSISHISDGEAFLLLTQKKGRLIKANAELARLQIRSAAIDSNANLLHWIKEVLLYIKDHQA